MRSPLVIVGIVLVAVLAAVFVFPSVWNRPARAVGFPEWSPRPFVLGLDLRGGVHLVYRADLSAIVIRERALSMAGVRDIIERRVNQFGVGEPLVQVDRAGEEWRLIVDLPGVRDIEGAIRTIGETPHLEFRLASASTQDGMVVDASDGLPREQIPALMPTGLTGRHLRRARVEFDPFTNRPTVTFELNEEGARLFGDITRDNVGRVVAIVLDGQVISAPIVQDEITTGIAQITGSFSVQEARDLVQRLNAGALPVPITIVEQNRVGPTLGAQSIAQSVRAAAIGLAALALFMAAWYRFPGLVAIAALALYIVAVLAVFKLVPVTLTLAGIAGFLLSIGMAVDANVLVFERMREERRAGRAAPAAVEEGFSRAWPSIRDGNVSTILTAVILYGFGTGVVRGFSLTLLIGVVISMATTMVVTRTFLRVRYR